MESIDLYKYSAKMGTALQRIKDESDNPFNYKYISGYVDLLKAKRARPGTICKHLSALRWFNATTRKNFRKVTQDELRTIIANIEYSDITENSKFLKKMVLRKFYEFLGEFYQCKTHLRWLKIKMPEAKKKRAEDMLKPNQILNMIDPKRHPLATASLREQALIATCFEGILRPHECLLLKGEDCYLTPPSGEMAKLRVKSLKSGERIVFLPNDCGAVDLLKQWIARYNIKPSDRVFNMSYYYAKKRIGIISNRVVGRKITQYDFRHSRATYLRFDRKLDPSIVKDQMGHSRDSTVLEDTYEHLAQENVINALKEAVAK